MKRILSALAIVLCFALEARASALSDAANALQPGNWVELTTAQISEVWGIAEGASGFISGFASELHFDDHARKLHYVGMDHADQIVHAVLTESNNTWSILADPPNFFGAACRPSCAPTANHQYDQMAFDPERREIYYRFGFSSSPATYWRWNVDSGTSSSWTQIASNSAVNAISWGAIEWVRWLGGLIHVQGSVGTTAGTGRVMLYNRDTNTWSLMFDNVDIGHVSNILECAEIIRTCILGSGESNLQVQNRKLWKLTLVGSTPTLTQLTDIPEAVGGIGVHNGGVLTHDPVSGEFLFMDDQVKAFWKYNVITDSWTQLTGAAVPPDTAWNQVTQPYDVHGVQAGPISTYGVVAFVSCQQGANPCRMFLYKHQAAKSYEQKCSDAQAAGDLIRCIPFDSGYALNYVHAGGACQTALGNTHFQDPTRANDGNSVAREVNGTCWFATIDTAFKKDGTASLKLPTPNGMSQNPITWDEPFSGLLGAGGNYAYFAPGSPWGNVGYIQYYMYMDQNFVDNVYACIDATCAMKVNQFYGDPGPDSTSCCTLGMAVVNWAQTGAWAAYTGDPGGGNYTGMGEPQDIRGCSWTVYDTTQPFDGALFLEPPCVKWKANQWQEVTVRFEMLGDPNAFAGVHRVTVWINGIMIIDDDTVPFNIRADGTGQGKGIGSMDFTQQLSFKDPNFAHATAFAWYDNLIISKSPIQMSNGIPAGADLPTPVQIKLSQQLKFSVPLNLGATQQ